MSIRIIQEVWDHSQAREGTLLVLLAIADSADAETREAFPTVKYLAEKTRLSERAVKYATKRLIGLGELEVLERGGRRGDKARANTYRVTPNANVQDLPVGLPPTGKSRQPNVQSTTPLYSEPSLEPSYLPDKHVEAVREVFSYWQKRLGTDRSRLTRGRADKIRARLNAGATVEEIKRAIDGCAGSEFHTENGHVDLTLICRSDEKLEQFQAMPADQDEEDFFAGTEFA